ncbi:MAG TPA: hypothetical protein VLI04_05030 [Nocardioidaceae bacterium]|nr:hypothetical protein [Nocardioidaceae bacterium]
MTEGTVVTWPVPAGWAETVARTYTRLSATSLGFLERLVLGLIAGVVLGVTVGWGGLAFVLVFPVVSLARTYFGTRRQVARLVPEGSTVAGTFGPESFQYERGGVSDLFRYDDCSALSVRGEVLCLRLRSSRRWGTFPAALFGPEPRAALQSAAKAGRSRR